MNPFEIHGYPVEVFYVAAFIGLVLLLLRPKWAFFFSVFCLSMRHFYMAAFTRTPFLGEFFNLNDLFLWIGVLAMLRNVWNDKSIHMPPILAAIFGVITVGSFQVLYLYGLNHDVMQEIWRAWIFPIMFLVGANVVRENEDARPFFWVLFLGSLGAALQHLLFLQTKIEIGEVSAVMAQLRTVAFIMSGGIFLVVAALYLDMRRILGNAYLFVFWVTGVYLIGLSYLLSFTRTWWVGAILAAAALFAIFYREWGKLLPRIGYTVVLLLLLFVAFRVVNLFSLFNADLTRTVEQRADFMRYEDSFDEAYHTRESGMETELNLWQNGTIIWGVGTSYAPSYLESTIESSGAMGHVAFSVYLAKFGLIGFTVYGLLLPFFTIKYSRRYYLQHMYDYGGVVAVTAMALACFDVFTLASSNHYIASTTQVQGLIYGSFWGLARSLKIPAPWRSPARKMISNQQNLWLAGPVNR
jgi:hypothetical protein